jgi:hypothetical protein
MVRRAGESIEEMYASWRLIWLIVFSSILVVGCSTAPLPQATLQQNQAMAQFDLGKCEVLEPSLYRCPGFDRPLCDPDFDRVSVQCVKITRNGVLLQAFPQQ